MAKKRVELAVFHCTATPRGFKVTKQKLEQWGYERGWRKQLLGYREICHQDGVVETLVENNNDAYVDPWEITNGARGHNNEAWHYVYAGGTEKDVKIPKDTRTAEQRLWMFKKCHELVEKYPWIQLAGHNQLDPKKDCPSFDFAAYARSIGIAEKNIYKS